MKRAPCRAVFPWLFSTLLAVAGTVGAAGDADEREKLPLYQTIPAAQGDELTPAQDEPDPALFRTWGRSHGDSGSRRYSALAQVNRGNVKQLQVAWTYHSGDGSGNIQCNPIVVEGVMYAPTVGRAIVAVDAVTGKEKWRFQLETPPRLGLEDAPARRGLLYWAGVAGHGPRIVFSCGNWIYALDPETGRPLADFGRAGRTALPTGGTAGGVAYGHILITSGLWGDIFG